MKKEGILHKRGCVKTHPLQKFAVFILAARRTGIRRPILSATQSLRHVTVDALQSDALAIRLALRCCLYRV